MRSKEDVIRIVRKLLKKTTENGFTIGEAAWAAQRAQMLLEKYQLSMVDVASKTLNEDMVRKILDSGRSVRNPGECCLAQAIADGCDVELVVSHLPNYSYNFVGFTSDVEVACYLFESLRDGLTKRATSEGQDNNVRGPQLVRWRNNFLMGAASEIRRRLHQAKQERQREFEAAVAAQEAANVAQEASVAAHIQTEPTTTASVQAEAEVDEPESVPQTTVSPRALVEIKKPQVQSFLKKTYPKLEKSSSIKVRSNRSALNLGRKAGREVPIRPGVGVSRPDKLTN